MAAVEFASLTLASDANLKAYYKLSDVNDSSGNGYTLTNNGTVTFAAGKFGNAADTGASNSTKWLSVAADVGWTGTAGTISGWFNITTAPGANTYNYLAEVSDATTKTALFLAYRDDAGTKKIYFGREKVGTANQGVDYTYTLTVGTWYHLAVTYNGTNVEGYINGVSIGTGAASGDGAYGGTIDALSIMGYGAIGGGANQVASGLADDIEFFNRALTASEVAVIATGSSIFFDAFTDLGSTTGTSLTTSHTCGSDTNRILFVATEGALVNASDVITGVTYNGVSLTKIGNTVSFDFPARFMGLWYLQNPATGAHNVVITGSSSDYIAGIATSYGGSKTTGGLDNSTSTTTGASSVTTTTTTLTTVADNCWTVMLGENSASAATAGAGTVKRGNQANDVAMTLFDSAGPISPAGSTSLIQNFSSGRALTIMASFAPVNYQVSTFIPRAMFII